MSYWLEWITWMFGWTSMPVDECADHMVYEDGMNPCVGG